MKKLIYFLILLVGIQILPLGARAQINGVDAITVTNSPSNITTDRICTQVLIRENSASPSAVFSITLSGTSVAQNFAAGAAFLFVKPVGYPFKSGEILGTIVATTSGPFTFTITESDAQPSMQAKMMGGVSAGGAPSGAAGGVLSGAYPNPAIAMGGGSVATNIAIGATALEYNFTGAENTAVGYNALQGSSGAMLTGSENTALGYNALLDAQTTANDNVAIGVDAMQDCTACVLNVALGVDTLTRITTGDHNMAIGSDALINLTTGEYNTAVGFGALEALTTQSQATAIGYDAAKNSTSSTNLAIGFQALQTVTSNGENTAVGYNALANATGGYNTVLGMQAGVAIASGADNTLIGDRAGQGITGNGNIVVGQDNNSVITSGGGNVVIGNNLTKATNSSSYQLDIGDVITATGINTPSSSILTIQGFQTITPIAVSALPSAAAGNAGQWKIVNNSTTVSAEGQTCVDNGATTLYALAFSNGSVWKCL